MYKILPFIVFITILSSCNQELGDIKNTPILSSSGSQVISESGITNSGIQEELHETLTGAHEEYYPIFDGTGTKVINAVHEAGKKTKVSFINSSAKSVEVIITFPVNSPGTNLRFSQVIMPDGTMDGPFGQKIGYNLTQKGGYTFIFSENMMQGDTWSGNADIHITLRDTPYENNVELLP